EALAPQVAVIDVRTNPPGAVVYLQRKDLGSVGDSPQELGLPAGTYTVLVERPGYEPRSVVVKDLALGERRSLDLELKPILGTVVVEGAAAQGATLDVGGISLPRCEVPCEVQVPP